MSSPSPIVGLLLAGLLGFAGPALAQDLVDRPVPAAKPDPAAPIAAEIVELAALPIPTPLPRPSVPDGYQVPPPDLSLPARYLFGGRAEPAPLEARSIGSYARGCLAGAVPLPVDGATWQVMRLSRNRNWGHPELIAFLERLAADAPDLGWNGLLVGDMAQPRGGPMVTGHASHQIGLDADIWLTPMPDHTLSRDEREQMSAVSMLKDAGMTVDPAIWTDSRARLIKRAASDPEVERIFVHPAIKKALCDFAGDTEANADWLSHVRPWYGHHYHFHVRLKCPEDQRGCKNQAPPPPRSGCGADLAWWFTDEPYKPKPGTPGKRRETLLTDLPAACRTVLLAD
ncbi:penicillin-insensitive murein endopeptidase [Amorphus sp. 3PC139-8]|uniref:penicillin-insensitive murein endopeptidase n=1 Tax=Amorphus sp. 3PC139-8 TaxID=2735676 RepID=UPI00345C9502